MSMPMGMVMVFPEGAVPRKNQEQVVVRAMGLQIPHERHAHSNNGEIVDIAGWLADGTMSMRRDPVGFDLLKVTWSPNALISESESVTDVRMDSIERVAIACLDELGARFGYMTHYTNQLGEDWIEQEVLVPLLCENWNGLVAPLYHFVVHASDIPIICPETATVVYTSKAGRIVRLWKHRNPFGPFESG